MNDIIYAGAANAAPARTEKVFKVLLPSSGGSVGEIEYGADCAVVLPPFFSVPPKFCGDMIAIDRALIPIKKPALIKNRAEIRFVFSQAAALKGADAPRGGLILAALGDLIAAYVTAFCSEGAASPIVENVRAEIERSLSDPTFSLKSYLKTLPLNYDYIRRLFKAQTGMSPHDYLVSRRMQLAANMLSGSVSNRYSKYSVAQVAEACGFYEPLYFSRVFKQYYGVSPSEFSENN